MKHLGIAAVAALAFAFTGCNSSVDMPKGSSRGYHSACLVQRNPGLPAIANPTEKGIHSMIQRSLRQQFTAKGIAYGNSGADLAVAYLVIYQEQGMTASYPDYFGYGRPADEVAGVAHDRGVVDSKRPDYFQRAGIVVDVIDAKTNKLLYRDFAAGDVNRSASDATRAARIDAAVAQALSGFFR